MAQKSNPSSWGKSVWARVKDATKRYSTKKSERKAVRCNAQTQTKALKKQCEKQRTIKDSRKWNSTL